MNIRRYSSVLITLFASTTISIWVGAIYLNPLVGDLTRIGGYTENDYHWNNPQEIFTTNLFTVAKSLEEYDKDYDVVILGDSFSCDQEIRKFGWQNYFRNQTGLSVLTLDTRKYWPFDVIHSENFKKHPPRFFIFESVERYAYDRLSYFAKEAIPPASAIGSTLEPLTIKPMGIQTEREKLNPRGCLDTDYVLGYLNARMERLFGWNKQVQKLPVTKTTLFSAKENEAMLIYFDEVSKQKLTEENWKTLREGMLHFQNIVESNGVTRLVYLIAPDKSAVYSPYLTSPADATVNLIEHAAKESRLRLIRSDLVLAEEIKKGTPDVYLPNDSHWGSIGHQRVAEAILSLLAKDHVIEPSH